MHSNFCIFFLVWPKFGRIYKIPFYRFILFVVGHLTTITYLNFWQGNQIHIPVLVTECNSKSKHLLECTIALLNVVMCTLLQIRVRQQQWFAMLHIGGGCLPRSFNYGWSEISAAATAGTYTYIHVPRQELRYVVYISCLVGSTFFGDHQWDAWLVGSCIYNMLPLHSQFPSCNSPLSHRARITSNRN